ncbi:L-2-hydroxyglutarate dehydrogenase, mitochondrial [Leptinotarsa decemlineata]|uniref:L-2-hydroxyglutarate dehydrogenase, mitochondrial n=1 Tax=Leptinotarsa decemlineata TaxID=7539 RepID=UPI003D308499
MSLQKIRSIRTSGWAPICTWEYSKAICNRRSFSNLGNDSTNYDVVVVGGGIVGVATAREMKERNPKLRMALVEKENKLAVHQSGHNSGVIHAGIYYKPGSLKAKLCLEGLHLTYEYCDKKKIPYKKVGKLIIATSPLQVQRLHELQERGIQNGVPDLKLLKGEAAIKEKEPHCTGLEALWSPHTGIVDWALVTKQYGKDFEEKGGDIHVNFEVNGFKKSDDADHPVLVTSKSGQTIRSKYILTCGGLHSDKLAELSGCPRTPRIVPFRGEFLLLKPEKSKLINGNIYPVPDPRLPFVGVHFTPRMDGSVWLGPNAVLAFQREGYRWTDINPKELLDALSYPGFLKMAFRFSGAGISEITKSLCTSMQIKELRSFFPSITVEDVVPGPSGVRAQALDEQGNLVDDFYFDMNTKNNENPIGHRILHCRNAPSPGATSSLAIAKMIADKLMTEFRLNYCR